MSHAADSLHFPEAAAPARVLSGRRPGSYQPRATPWVHRGILFGCRPTACFIGIEAGADRCSPPCEDTMNRAFSASKRLWDRETQGFALGWYERRLWRLRRRTATIQRYSGRILPCVPLTKQAPPLQGRPPCLDKVLAIRRERRKRSHAR